jgi:hypothetical protein
MTRSTMGLDADPSAERRLAHRMVAPNAPAIPPPSVRRAWRASGTY